MITGPWAASLLADQGATVIKIEAPGGDVNRWTGSARSPGMSTGQLIKGRNKRAVLLDLKQAEARIQRNLKKIADYRDFLTKRAAARNKARQNPTSR